MAGLPRRLTAIGDQNMGFHFDNETPRHRVWLMPFELNSSLVNNAGFIADWGYQWPELWMSELGIGATAPVAGAALLAEAQPGIHPGGPPPRPSGTEASSELVRSGCLYPLE